MCGRLRDEESPAEARRCEWPNARKRRCAARMRSSDRCGVFCACSTFSGTLGAGARRKPWLAIGVRCVGAAHLGAERTRNRWRHDCVVLRVKAVLGRCGSANGIPSIVDNASQGAGEECRSTRRGMRVSPSSLSLSVLAPESDSELSARSSEGIQEGPTASEPRGMMSCLAGCVSTSRKTIIAKDANHRSEKAVTA